MKNIYFKYKSDEYKLFMVLFSCETNEHFFSCWNFYTLFIKKWTKNKDIDISYCLKKCDESFIKNYKELVSKLK